MSTVALHPSIVRKAAKDFLENRQRNIDEIIDEAVNREMTKKRWFGRKITLEQAVKLVKDSGLPQDLQFNGAYWARLVKGLLQSAEVAENVGIPRMDLDIEEMMAIGKFIQN